LSAALPERFRPATPWMLTLAERFELNTGRCLAPDVPDERRPRVQVYDRDRPWPEPPPRPRVGRTAPVAPEPNGSDKHAVDYPRTTKRRLVPVAELDGGAAPALAGPLRAVLKAWDFRDPDGWRPLLQRLCEPAVPPAEWQQMLERFAASEIRERLAESPTCLREVDYFLPLSMQNAPATLHGVIDCLWQDADGRWRLLFYTSESPDRRDEHWQERLPGLTLAATAHHAQTGTWPATVTLHFLRDGTSVERTAARLPHRRVLAEAARRLEEVSLFSG